MPEPLLSERAVTRWFAANHPSAASDQEDALARRLGPTIDAPDRIALESICSAHILETEIRVLLLVGTLLCQHGQEQLWQQIYRTVEEKSAPAEAGQFLHNMTTLARAGKV